MNGRGVWAFIRMIVIYWRTRTGYNGGKRLVEFVGKGKSEE